LLRELLVVVDLDQQYSADGFRMDLNDSGNPGIATIARRGRFAVGLIMSDHDGCS
jgi:hypothetical protein